ncbi:MAG: hypothetical protein ABFC78_08935, partial [Methanoregula sp.]
LLNVTDLLIAGPYVGDLACGDPYIGSSNQQVISLTGKIRSDGLHEPAHGEIVEFTITPDGTITTTGFPQKQLVRQIAARCRGE